MLSIIPDLSDVWSQLALSAAKLAIMFMVVAAVVGVLIGLWFVVRWLRRRRAPIDDGSAWAAWSRHWFSAPPDEPRE